MSRDRTRCLHCGLVTTQLLVAEALADAVEHMIRVRLIDARSPAADALLDYRYPSDPDRESKRTEPGKVGLT